MKANPYDLAWQNITVASGGSRIFPMLRRQPPKFYYVNLPLVAVKEKSNTKLSEPTALPVECLKQLFSELMLLIFCLLFLCFGFLLNKEVTFSPHHVRRGLDKHIIDLWHNPVKLQWHFNIAVLH